MSALRASFDLFDAAILVALGVLIGVFLGQWLERRNER
jgi:hypothetical protein